MLPMSQPNGANGYHAPTPDPVPAPSQRTPTTTIAVLLTALISGTGGSVVTYGVARRPRPPCAVAPAKDDCTCPKCEAGQRCSPATCPTCVDLAVSRELRINALERQVQKIRQVSACGGDGNLLDSALR